MPHHQHQQTAIEHCHAHHLELSGSNGADGRETTHSPVPSLTHADSRSTSASSSVNSMSPGALMTTPRDLLPHFKSVGSNKCSSRSTHGDDGKVTLPDAPVELNNKRPMADDACQETAKRQRKEAPVAVPATAAQRPHTLSRPKRLTGSDDFVKKFGLSGLYDQYVRPYAAIVGDRSSRRRPLPDLTSAYLTNVRGAANVSANASRSSLDLMALVMAPPKNEFERLDLLPMASIKAAFSISSRRSVSNKKVAEDGTTNDAAGVDAKRSRISLKVSTDALQSQHHSQSQRQDYRRQQHVRQDPGRSQTKEREHEQQQGHGSMNAKSQQYHSRPAASTLPNRA
ncbi:hypothetical protein BX661DRAFT_169481 [Kickxella alabastrina]|uniref:uncharacterized protein n=1 Tax=Kickxella alabastrina TaxID=61397 RepID=UPI00221E76EA|nr:uncharacterized protein BX661DRAFT_169481 [Kickxella alabastrina]KAI7832949.1 hypothetical protein BX661DRAFT_169481 [Kickxella alabastrina]